MALLPACAKGAVVASKAVSWCTKLERHPLKAYFWRAVGQQGAEHKLGRLSILRLVPEDAGHLGRGLRQGRVAGGYDERRI